MPDRAVIQQAAWTDIEVGLRIALGGFFIFAALPKIADPTLFALQIGDYQLLSDPWPTVMAVSMPWLELLVGVAIVVRKLYLGSLLTVIGMLVAFMIALSTLIVRNLDVECGCFGSGGTAPEAMARDVILLAIAIGLVVLNWRRARADA